MVDKKLWTFAWVCIKALEPLLAYTSTQALYVVSEINNAFLNFDEAVVKVVLIWRYLSNQSKYYTEQILSLIGYSVKIPTTSTDCVFIDFRKSFDQKR